jgi:hypothetical protein
VVASCRSRISITSRAHEYIPGPAARHNGGTQNVRPIVHGFHDQNILSGHDSAL